jgi:hypothetical protein
MACISMPGFFFLLKVSPLLSTILLSSGYPPAFLIEELQGPSWPDEMHTSLMGASEAAQGAFEELDFRISIQVCPVLIAIFGTLLH